jgi:hypothetical protein
MYHARCQGELIPLGSSRAEVDRFALLPDGAAAYTLEAMLKKGEWVSGRPLLNPLK